MNWRGHLAPDDQRKLGGAPTAWHTPMLATLAKGPPRGEYVYERKLDGFRVVAVCTSSGARLYSRSVIDVTARFPLTDGLPRRPCVLDGEAVAFSGDQESFAAVQRGAATHLVFFDIMQLDGIDVRGLAWEVRRPLLDELAMRAPCARLPWTEGDPRQMLERACDAGWEGLIAKQRHAPYVPGRSRAWLKLKCVRGQEFVIGGFTEPAGSRTGLGALLVGYHDKGREGGLRYAGKVGTGFDEATLKSLTRTLSGMEQADAPFVDAPRMDACWVRPELVCRVDFTEWTRDGRLRHPRFLGLRDDKAPQEVVREA